MWNEFREFIARGNVIDLAVGIIIGAAFTTIVNSLVTDIIMPPIGFIFGDVDFSELFIVLGDAPEGGYASLQAAQDAGAATINYGLFITNVINFLLVAIAMFFVVRAFNSLKRKQEDPEVAAPVEPTTEQRLVETLDKLNTTLERME